MKRYKRYIFLNWYTKIIWKGTSTFMHQIIQYIQQGIICKIYLSQRLTTGIRNPMVWNSIKFFWYVMSNNSRGHKRDVVYLGRPIVPSYMSPNAGGGGAGPLSQWVQLCTYCRARINFGDLTPYLTYGDNSNSCMRHPTSTGMAAKAETL
jgi:hypothetical protein